MTFMVDSGCKEPIIYLSFPLLAYHSAVYHLCMYNQCACRSIMDTYAFSATKLCKSSSWSTKTQIFIDVGNCYKKTCLWTCSPLLGEGISCGGRALSHYIPSISCTLGDKTHSHLAVTYLLFGDHHSDGKNILISYDAHLVDASYTFLTESLF